MDKAITTHGWKTKSSDYRVIREMIGHLRS